MKTYFHAFAMCQSMFCAIPFPGNIWDEKARDKMLLFLPLVGLEMGAIWAVLAWLCNFLQLPVLVKGLILAVFPYLVAGFIHLDGYMDVTDAVKSCRSLERRREILKDSHVGAFAVIGCVLLMLSAFAFGCAGQGSTRIFCLISRITLAVKHYVARVKIDADVVKTYLLDSTKNGNGSFLTRLKKKRLAALLHLFTDIAKNGNGAAKILVIVVFGQKADVSCYHINTDLLRKLGAEQKILFTDAAVCGRNETERLRTVCKVPLTRAAVACPEGSHLNTRSRHCRFYLFGVLVGIPRRQRAPQDDASY